MVELSKAGRARIAEIAARHGVDTGTAERLFEALARGGGNQAQFSEPELGGMGQWSRGGMIMIGDMFNNALKARVDALCLDLAGLLGTDGVFEPAREAARSGFNFAGASAGWPAELGSPSSSGSQNDMRYAVFPGTRRLAVARGGTVTVYDTGDHLIGGVSQAQSGDQSLSFTSQLGRVSVADLKVVTDEEQAAPAAPDAPAPAATAPAPDATPDHTKPEPRSASAAASPAAVPRAEQPAGIDVLGTIERLADLRSRGVLTDEEFARKKAELLDRL